MEFLNRTYLGNTLQGWLIAAGIALGGFLLLFLVKQIVRNRLLRLVKKSRSNVDDFIIPLVNQTRWFFLLALTIREEVFGSATIVIRSSCLLSTL